MRRDIRVTVSSTATASASSPATWPVSPGRANASGDAVVAGWAFRVPPSALAPGVGLGTVAGLIAGNRPDALPAFMNWLDALLRFGITLSGSVVPGGAPTPAPFEDDDWLGEGDAAVTSTVSAAVGGVHFSVVVTLAVAVSVTEVTDVASAAIGICACTVTGFLSDTAPTVQVAVPWPLAQSLVKAGFWLDGWAARATFTPDAEPLFWVETFTT